MKRKNKLDLLKDILIVLEQRREQINNRSNILVVVNTALIAGLTQFLFKDDIIIGKWFILILGSLSFVTSMLSILEAINIIKRLKRNKAFSTKSHLFFFSYLSTLTKEQFQNRINSLNPESTIDEYMDQALSLSKDLKKRYTALGKSFRYFVVSLILFSLAIVIPPFYINITKAKSPGYDNIKSITK